MIIYNDRVNSFRKMKVIDAVVDEKPTTTRIIELVELGVRNRQCFRELQTFNDTGKWLNRHPLLKHFSLHAEMNKLLQKDRGEYLQEYTKTSGYVSRYRSYLNNDKRSPSQHEKDEINLKKHSEREQIMKEVLDEQLNRV